MTSLPEIFKLNVFCLFEIFKQIKMNCETSKSLQNRHKLVQYSDLINFVICHEVFTKAFEEWSHSLYKFLEIDYAFLNTCDLLKIDFAKIYETLKKVSKTDRELFWKFCANAIEENELLSSVTLIYHPTRFYPDHLDSFEAVVNSLKNKKSLRTLVVDVSGYSLPYVPCITTLTKLELNVRMEIEDLLQFCQSNPNLRFLNFHHTELQGRLSDILPYCNKLNTLAFTMKPDIDASEYADVAKLTQLRQLRLKGVHQEGTLLELLMGLKLKRLRNISIPNSFLTKGESLKELHIHVVFISYCIENLINALVNPSHQKLRKLSLTLCPYKVQDFTKLMMAIASIGLLTNLNELYIENPEGFP
ncbi:uncharacterized protein LOC120449367 [Drosophila santomea]|uniref:uncharacterized protein LOC120449367 n=1 Tax=Drosophila santomea TaxID=129105 RepID=UPI001954463B|nr:uncharacterized protein LOC120449367 [Drosophila santomea]